MIFTKQEQRFLLFLLVTFLVGLAVKFIRRRVEEKPNETWIEQRRHILAEFEEKSLQVNREDSVAADIIRKDTHITKEFLTKSININVASYEELQLLPRIGPATAEKIIAFREKNGPFSVIEDIQNVKSIGPKTFERIKEYITVD